MSEPHVWIAMDHALQHEEEPDNHETNDEMYPLRHRETRCFYISVTNPTLELKRNRIQRLRLVLGREMNVPLCLPLVDMTH